MAFVAAPLSRTLYPSHDVGIIPRLEPKDPNAVLNYVWSWGDWLDIEGATAASFTVAIDGVADNALALDSQAADAASPTGRSACGWFSGGTDGQDYLVRCRVVTAAGVTEDRSFWLPVRRR